MRVAVAHARTHLQVLLNYRANFVTWMLLSLLMLSVSTVVWQAVAREQGGSVGGYSPGAIAAYFVAMLLVRTLTIPSIVWKTANEVRDGTLAVRLLRPYHPFLAIHAMEGAATLLSYGVALVLGVPMAVLAGATFDAPLASVLAGAALVPLAVLARYVLESLLATLALKTVRIDGPRAIYVMTCNLLGGVFAPIGVFPDWAAALARALPFYWILGFPVELVVGRADLHDAPLGAAVLLAWSAVLFAAFRVAWRAGLRALESVGQ